MKSTVNKPTNNVGLCLKLTDQEAQTYKERQEALNQWFAEHNRKEQHASFLNQLTVLEI